MTFVAEGQQVPETPDTSYLNPGETLVLVLLTPLDSGSSQVGDDISLKVLLPLTVQGTTVLPAGLPVHGRVSAVRRAGRDCKPGMIALKLDEITVPDGKKINISLDRKAKREKKIGKRITEIVKYTALAPLVLVALPYIVILWIGMHDEGGCHGAVGAEEKFPVGTAFSVEVSKDTLLPRIP